MSVMEPDDGDDIFAQLSEQLSDIEIPNDVSNVQKLSDLELAADIGRVRNQLISIGEMQQPKTEMGRNLHSRRSALLIEKNRRLPPGT